MNHTSQCLEKQADFLLAEKEYIDTWPDYCKYCNGWGGSSQEYDPSPAGVGLGAGYFVEYSTCPNCVEKGLCPRCGKDNQIMIGRHYSSIQEWEGDTCRRCNWVHSSGGYPLQPSCICPDPLCDQEY